MPAELPIQERGEHADRPMREVEDARGGIGHDQASRGNGVDRSEGQAYDRKGYEIIHEKLSRDKSFIVPVAERNPASGTFEVCFWTYPVYLVDLRFSSS